jgi:hypothetical protein
MSDTLHIVGNDKGADDRVCVIFLGDVVYDGVRPNARAIHAILEGMNGAAEFIKYHSCNDVQMKDPMTVVYPD